MNEPQPYEAPVNAPAVPTPEHAAALIEAAGPFIEFHRAEGHENILLDYEGLSIALVWGAGAVKSVQRRMDPK